MKIQRAAFWLRAFRSRNVALFSSFPHHTSLLTAVSARMKRYRSPFFIADRSIVLDRYRSLRNALNVHWKNSIIAYSFKTNYAVAKDSLLRRAGAWAEVVSEREYMMALGVGYTPETIIYNGPHKSPRSLRYALERGTRVNVDSNDELCYIASLSRSLRRKFRIGLRMNIPVKGMTGSRFGFSVQTGEADAALRTVLSNKYLSCMGFHVHIGTDIGNIEIYRDASRQLIDYITPRKDLIAGQCTYLDVGGGVMSHGLRPYSSRRYRLYSVSEYLQAWTSALSVSFSKSKAPILFLEPGRYLVDDAGLFVCRVVSVRKRMLTQFVVTDASVSMLPLSGYRPQIVQGYDGTLQRLTRRTVRTIVYGATCREDDRLHEGFMPELVPDDVLLFFCTGAYNYNFSNDFIFSRPAHYLY